MRISEAAQSAGVGVETVRFYERKGLIEQPTKPLFGGFRIYPTATVERIRFIRQAQDIGFSLREVKALLSLRVDPDADCAEVRAHAQTKLGEVDRKIANLQTMKGALVALIETCPGEGALGKCSIIEALTMGVKSSLSNAEQADSSGRSKLGVT